MKWLKRLAWLCATLGILAGLAGWFWWASRQSPDFYRVAELQVSNPIERKQVAQQFVERSQHIVEEIKSAPRWSEEFTDAQINAWLIEEFPGEFSESIPPEVSQPRVSLQPDGVRLGFKVDSDGPWKGIVSVHANARLETPNQLAVRLLSVRVGLVPMPLNRVIDLINEHVREADINITWQQRDGFQEALIPLDPEAADLPQLEQIEFLKGVIRFSGSNNNNK